MRLLQCKSCRTIEEFPDPPKGVDPHNISPGEDPLFDHLLERHKFPNGEEHFGLLHAVPNDQWRLPGAKEEILKKLNEAESGLGQEVYELRDTFREDAMTCFRQHQRPHFCPDWMDDSKRLGRPTPEGRAWAKMNFKAPMPYLCHFCPVASNVMTAERNAAGMYDN